MPHLKDIVLFVAGLVLIVVLAGLLGGFIGYDKGRSICEDLPSPDTVVKHHTDTVRIKEPPSVVTNTVTKYVQVPKYVTKTDTVIDSIMVPLPFEQHFTQLDDVADVWFSGYDAKIDSAIVYKQHTVEIIHQTKLAPLPKNMVMATAGASDASMTYMRRIGPVWIGASAGYTYDGIPTVRGSIGIQF